jgi:hypothetical protein
VEFSSLAADVSTMLSSEDWHNSVVAQLPCDRRLLVAAFSLMRTEQQMSLTFEQQS